MKIKALQVHNILLVPSICHAPMTHWEISHLLRTATFSLLTSACEQPLLCACIGYLFRLNEFQLLIHKPAP